VGTRVRVAAAAILLLAPVMATAQPPADPLEQAVRALTPGQQIVLRDVGGGDTRGRVVDVTPASITLAVAGGANGERRSFERITIATIRRTDSLWSGLLIGAASGFVATEVWARQSCGNDGECAAITRVVGWGALGGGGAAVGALIDRLIGNELIYRAATTPSVLQVTPLVGRGTAGLSLSLRF